jgi:hypothetical protein
MSNANHCEKVSRSCDSIAENPSRFSGKAAPVSNNFIPGPHKKAGGQGPPADREEM